MGYSILGMMMLYPPTMPSVVDPLYRDPKNLRGRSDKVFGTPESLHGSLARGGRNGGVRGQ